MPRLESSEAGAGNADEAGGGGMPPSQRCPPPALDALRAARECSTSLDEVQVNLPGNRQPTSRHDNGLRLHRTTSSAARIDNDNAAEWMQAVEKLGVQDVQNMDDTSALLSFFDTTPSNLKRLYALFDTDHGDTITKDEVSAELLLLLTCEWSRS
jgi:hypothetical protein